MSKIAGYRLEWRAGNYVFETTEDYAVEINKASARIHSLHTAPQPNCDQEVYLYFGAGWVKAENLQDTPLEGFVPLYLGPLIWEPIDQYLKRTGKVAVKLFH
jgi:hypothetical protein